jgi:hypothetical protein
MAMNAMLPMFFLLSERNDRRRDVADALLPAMAPIPVASRVALTAVMADSAVRRQESNADQVAEQAIGAATSPSLDATRLGQYDRLAPVFARRPDLREQLLEQAPVGDAVVKLVQAVKDKGAFDLQSDEARPLRERLSSDQLSQLETALNGAAPAAVAAKKGSDPGTTG